VSLPEIHAGDVGLGNPFRVTCESVEAIHPITGTDLLVGCDNNLPNTGRNPTIADDTELIVVKVPRSARRGLAANRRHGLPGPDGPGGLARPARRPAGVLRATAAGGRHDR
jgi:hypothetical protein